MTTIYVAGPVERPNEPITELTEQVYQTIRDAAASSWARVLLPEPEPQLDSAEPQMLVQAIKRRIESSDATISMMMSQARNKFEPGALGGAVEATIAAFAGKRQLLITDVELPRMIQGLPTVKHVLRLKERQLGEEERAEIRQFVRAL